MLYLNTHTHTHPTPPPLAMIRREFLSRVGDYEAPRLASGVRPPSSQGQRTRRWLGQCVHWILCAVIARMTVFLILYVLHRPLSRVALLLGGWACTAEREQTKIWVVLVIIPLFLDSAQFIIQAFWLRANPLEEGPPSSSGTMQAAGEDAEMLVVESSVPPATDEMPGSLEGM